ncbi:uncharacterized protein LOC135947174 [Cloeon dipterum]|uniref:uncharacterized protein LOC135947174 n=1 Tax=Cloeon dipterum TaxID=197152 RepID=UPI00321FB90C
MWPFPEGHTCRVCKRVLCSVRGREQHEREAHPPTVTCPICLVKHYDEMEVLNHLETHLPLICGHPRCGYFISTKMELLQHRAFENLQNITAMSSMSMPVQPSTSSAKTEPAARAPASPRPLIHFEKSPMCTPKRRYPMESPILMPQIAGAHNLIAPKTPVARVAAQSSTSLTPALSSLRLMSPASPHYRSCIDEDELMVSALDSSPLNFHSPNCH